MTPKKIIIRAVKTAIQTLIALLGLDAVGVIASLPTADSLIAAGVAALLSAINNAIADLEGSLP